MAGRRLGLVLKDEALRETPVQSLTW